MWMGDRGRTTLTPLLLLLLLLLLLVDPGEGCGRNPIRGSGRRRRPRRLTALVFKQHVPNVSENTLGASGLEDGRIKRGDAKFKDLSKNNNPDILFKDEEGTGADRLMSHRCKQKLNTLAISVLNQWPGVKLRVTEAWDEDNMHASNSLHYEGRAVDITTSDRDRSKYGMLARLAVEAGFDWVYYESRGHIHCSVKSDSSVAIKIGGCFSSDSHVILSSGQTLSLANLQVGHSVLAMNSQGQLVFSDVIGFLDRSANQRALFYTLTTESGKSISLTAKHLIYVGADDRSLPSTTALSPSSDLPLKFAEDVKTGDFIVVTTHGPDVSWPPHSLRLQRVVSVTVGTSKGVYAPLTSEGTIVVDGTVASCYAFLNDQTFVHRLFAPIRAFYAIKTFIFDWWDFSVWNLPHWLVQAVTAPFSSSPMTDEGTDGSLHHHHNWTLSSTNSESTPGVVEQAEGAHWYAQFLYKVAVNIVGMDLFISM